MLYPFSALLARMKYITRWSLTVSYTHLDVYKRQVEYVQ